MTIDDLSGLGVELRKAAKTTEQIRGTLAQLSNYKNTKNPEGIELFLKFKRGLWLPADLAAQEMQRIKKVLKDKICLNKTFCGKKDKPELTMSGLVSIKNWHCRNCEKVEEAFKDE